MTRGVLYIVWKGSIDPTPLLDRSIASLKRWHPELPHHVEWLPAGSTLLDKAKMLDISPFDQTLFLDADTVVMGKLDFGFQQASKHGVAMCINVNPWARRYSSLRNEGDLPEYDTGVIFINRHKPGVPELFAEWKRLSDLDSSSYFKGPNGIARMPKNDQCGFAAAVESREFNPCVLPVNFNFHPRWQKTLWGELKIWHSYDEVHAPLVKWNEAQSADNAVIECGQLP